MADPRNGPLGNTTLRSLSDQPSWGGGGGAFTASLGLEGTGIPPHQLCHIGTPSSSQHAASTYLAKASHESPCFSASPLPCPHSLPTWRRHVWLSHTAEEGVAAGI